MKAFIAWMISLFGGERFDDLEVEWSGYVNARKVGNIKKSGKLLNCWTT
jgi:hypothetical protein